MSRIDYVSNLLKELQRDEAYIAKNDIELKGDSEANIGMVAARDLKPNTIIMGIPARAIIIPRLGHQSKYGIELLRICKESGNGREKELFSRKNSTFLALAMLEGLSSQQPITSLHMKSMPQTTELTSMPIFWNREDRRILRNCCSDFEEMLKNEITAWSGEYQTLTTLFDDFPFTEQEWHWARANIVSRNMQIPTEHLFNSVFLGDEVGRASQEAAEEDEVGVASQEAAEEDEVGMASQEAAEEDEVGMASQEAAEEAEEISRVPLSKSQKKRVKKKKKKKSVQSLPTTTPIIVPLADMANHSNDPNVIWGIDKDEGLFEMRTTRAISKGEEICFSYGPQSSSKYLLHYGFIPKDHHCCMLETTLTVSSGDISVKVPVRSASSTADFQSLITACRRVSGSDEVLSSRVNETAALDVAHKALRDRMAERVQYIRFIDQHKSASPVATSITALLQGENILIRSVIRVVEDASLYLGNGDEAQDIYAEYKEWGDASRGWKRHVGFAPGYIASLARLPFS